MKPRFPVLPLLLLLVVALAWWFSSGPEPIFLDQPSTANHPFTPVKQRAIVSLNQEEAAQKQADNIKRPWVAKSMTKQPGPENSHYSRNSNVRGVVVSTTKGAVRTKNGEILFQASTDEPLIDTETKSGVNQIVVISGNGKTFLVDMVSKKKTALPVAPAGKSAFAFGRWYWLDETTLIAQSGLFDANEKVTCCDGHKKLQTELYTYSIPSGVMTQVELPEAIRSVPFELMAVDQDGNLQLLESETHNSEGRPLGWFSVSKSPDVPINEK